VPSQPTGLRETIARNLDALIRESGMTNREVARRIDSTEHQVWRWRKGKVRPSDDNLAALASVLTDGDLGGLLLQDAA
jgi:transcriptional regulator with XRE-family HTH domain